MPWNVFFHDEFHAEFQAMDSTLQDELLAHARLLQDFGPNLGRPTVDTLKGSKHTNMKELRFTLSDGEWRIAFAFAPQRQAILLIGGSKSGTNKKQFYRDLIWMADERFNAHLKSLPTEDGGKR